MTDKNLKFNIDKNMPIPRQSRGSRYTALAKQMRVGDSVFVPAETQAKRYTVINQLRAACLRARLPRKFVSRSVVEGGVAGARIWRTK